jgi:hypothetical protein
MKPSLSFSVFLNLLIWLLLFSYPGFAKGPSLLDLAINTSKLEDNLAVFVSSTPQPHSISGINLHFLTGIDCYSGYLAPYQTADSDKTFPISDSTPFALSAKGIYQAARTAVSSEQINAIQSVLIRFISRERGTGYERFLRFTGSCQDQEINCCLPIACSETTEHCFPLASIDIQPLVW